MLKFHTGYNAIKFFKGICNNVTVGIDNILSNFHLVFLDIYVHIK